MRLSVVLGFIACFLLPFQSQAAWDIFQSYVILDSGSGDQFLAGGYNADVATAFDGSDLGAFAASDALTLNGGELKTYKNGSSNVCGGNVYYRVYASGDTPGSFSSVALPYDSDLANAGDQKWDETAAGIDLLAGLTAGGTYTLEVYWDLTGAESDPAGCGETKFDSDFGNNFTASFTFNVPGCTDPNYAEYDANANTDDSSCSTLIVNGCTDPAYTEYSASANSDDGSCSTLVVNGCTDTNYTEYDASANTDDGSCATLSGPFICGNTWSYDAHSYSTVQIGEQCWFSENLRTTTYADGTPIPAGLSNTEWSTTTDGAMAVYGQDGSPCSDYEGSCDDAISLERYGRLYNWYAVDDARGLCPTGWSVPSDDDWKALEISIGMSPADADDTATILDGPALQRGTNEGFKLKTDGQYPTVGFTLSNGWSNGSDEFGFAAMPGGRTENLTFENTGEFVSAGSYAGFWTSTASGEAAWRRELYSGFSTIFRRDDIHLEQTGMSVRCFRSSPILGCTDPDYLEYDATATGDDGSCATLAVNGCTDPSYSEYDAAANNNDGSCASQIPCYGALDLSISMDMPATTRFTLDGSATLVVNAGTPTSLTLTGQNGSPDYTFPQPGAIDGLVAGFYNVTATDASGCTSNETQLIIMYSQCCDCGENDQDADGICDDGDNCSDRLATNFDDPANEACIGGTVEGCTDPAAVNYNPSANKQREEPLISIAFNLISNLSSLQSHPTNPPNRHAWLYPFWGGASSNLAEYWPASEFPNAGTVVKTVSKPETTLHFNPEGKYTVRIETSGYWSETNSLTAHFANAAVTVSGDVVATSGDTTFYLTDQVNPGLARYNFYVGVCHYAGCTDPDYTEYDPDANLDDGSCSTSVVLGCTNPDAVNYDPSANTDDGSCCASPTMDGYTYDVVLIGNQCWYAENVRTTVYRNGNSISWAYDGPGNFGSLGSAEQQAYYNGGLWSYANEADGDTTSTYSNEHGLLYNWYAVNNSKICPVGWKTPTNTDWSSLAGFIQNQVGKKLKATSGWQDGGNGTDIYGWGGVPHYENGPIGRYWSQTALQGANYKSYRSLLHDSNGFPASGWYPTELLWARCLKQ